MLARLLTRTALRTATAAAAFTTGSSAHHACRAAPAPSQPAAAQDLFRLDGKVALVTGGSRGLGYAMAVGLAQQGAHVVIGGTNPTTLESARAALLEQVPAARCDVVAFDVGDAAACKAAVREVAACTGRSPDILVNNAGINRRLRLSEFDTETFEAVLRANLIGPFVLCREVAGPMQERGWGRIVNVGSIMSHVGAANLHAYCASKHALSGLTKSLATELGGDGVTVNCIAPGYFATDLTKPLRDNEGFDAKVRRRNPLGRWGIARELAGPCAFLCSDAASYVNGAMLVVDGGMISTFHPFGSVDADLAP